MTLNYENSPVCHCVSQRLIRLWRKRLQEAKQSLPNNIRDRHAPFGARDDMER